MNFILGSVVTVDVLNLLMFTTTGEPLRLPTTREGKMSHKDEILQQEQDDEAYERWFKSTPEYWAILMDELTAPVIASEGKNRYMVSGEINT